MSEAEQNTDVAAKAKTMGHVSKEEWKGDPAKWRPAEEFVERGENIMPILKKQVEKLQADLDMSLKMNDKRDEKIRVEAHDKATKEYEKKLAELDKKEVKAFDDGDSEAFVEIKKERGELEKPVKQEADKKPDINPDFKNWADKNTWYKEDEDLREYADMLGQRISQQKPGLAENKLYDAVTEQVKKMFPHKFSNPNRENAQSVEGDSGAPNKPGKNSFDDLPSTAKAAFKRLSERAKAQGREYTKAAYAEAYYE